MFNVDQLQKTIEQIQQTQRAAKVVFDTTTASKAKLALFEYASEKGIAIKLNPNEPLDSGSANTRDRCVSAGAWLKLSMLHTTNYKTILAATIAHEIGHIETLRENIDKKRRINVIVGLCNKYVLKSELLASAWALRFLRRYDDIDLKLARQFLKICYSTYRNSYSPELEHLFETNIK